MGGLLLAGYAGHMCYCGRAFVPKKEGQKFCIGRCRNNANSKLTFQRHRQKPEAKDVRCRGCRELFTIDPRRRGPDQAYCTHACKSRHAMRLDRMRKRLLRLGWVRLSGKLERWSLPGGESLRLKAALATVGPYSHKERRSWKRSSSGGA